MHGFEHTGSHAVPALRATIEQYVDRRSGARHVHMATEAQESAFLAGFPTLLDTSDGRAHILEHLALSGSRRFPVRAPFFAMLRRSLATHMNARTHADRTAYLFASTDRRDFFNLLDVYLDACFHPTLDYLDFLQEGWRHVLEDGKLALRGVVLSEMQGAMADPMHALRHGVVAALFKGTGYAADPGGDPLAIPGLSHTMLRAFHARHYHPSQAVFMSAGRIAPAQIQERIAACVPALQAGRAERLLPALACAWTAARAQQLRIPAQDGQPGGHGLQLAWVLGETGDALGRCSAELLWAGLLGDAAAPLRAALEAAGFGRPARLAGLDTDMRQMVFHVGMEGLDAARVDDARRLILSTLERVAAAGVAEPVLRCALRDLRYRQRDTDGGGHTPFALRRLLQALPLALYGGDVLDGFDNAPALAVLDARVGDPGFFKGLVRALLDNPTRLDTHVVPDGAYFAARAAAQQQALAARQAALPGAERARIEADAAALAARQALAADKALLPRIRPGDIDARARPLPAVERLDGGAWVVEAATNGITHARVLYDVSHLPADDWPWLALYVRVLPELGVGARDFRAAAAWRRAAAPEFRVGIDTAAAQDGGLHIDIAFCAAGLEGDEAALADLLAASAAGVRFDETARLAFLVERAVRQRMEGVSGAGRDVAMLAACAPLSAARRFWNAVDGIDALPFHAALGRLCRTPDGMARLAARLAALHAQVTAAAPARLCIGSGAAARALARLLAAPDAFGAAPVRQAAAAPVPRQPAANLALLGGGQVNHCAMAWRAPGIAHPDAAPLAVAAELMTAWLHRSLRERGGAYGAHAQYDGDARVFALASVHDPRLAGTYADFMAALDTLAHGDLDPESIEEAIVGAIKALDRPLPPQREAIYAWQARRAGVTPALRQGWRAAVLACTAAQIGAAARTWLAPAAASRAAFVGAAGQDLAGMTALDLAAMAAAPTA
ncbi:peptidase M16 [Massilia forsythiae]|uniref:Peptidase M16 n=1 Tax=Massilia forsythiae TaxID=2728020 RepID=A0A7Z2VZZ8_9BURK|nr:insulinase family protein [Massilia forsythiae]QJE02581.1 peptidase M16 [Massilia forsythiae]